MITVEYAGEVYECSRAIKGSDYVHLLDEHGALVASFDDVISFGGFILTGGSWELPVDLKQCHLAAVSEEGLIRSSMHKCKDVKGNLGDDPITVKSQDYPQHWAALGSGRADISASVASTFWGLGHGILEQEVTENGMVVQNFYEDAGYDGGQRRVYTRVGSPMGWYGETYLTGMQAWAYYITNRNFATVVATVPVPESGTIAQITVGYPEGFDKTSVVVSIGRQREGRSDWSYQSVPTSLNSLSNGEVQVTLNDNGVQISNCIFIGMGNNTALPIEDPTRVKVVLMKMFAKG